MRKEDIDFLWGLPTEPTALQDIVACGNVRRAADLLGVPHEQLLDGNRHMLSITNALSKKLCAWRTEIRVAAKELYDHGHINSSNFLDLLGIENLPLSAEAGRSLFDDTWPLLEPPLAGIRKDELFMLKSPMGHHKIFRATNLIHDELLLEEVFEKPVSTSEEKRKEFLISMGDSTNVLNKKNSARNAAMSLNFNACYGTGGLTKQKAVQELPRDLKIDGMDYAELEHRIAAKLETDALVSVRARFDKLHDQVSRWAGFDPSSVTDEQLEKELKGVTHTRDRLEERLLDKMGVLTEDNERLRQRNAELADTMTALEDRMKEKRENQPIPFSINDWAKMPNGRDR